MGIFRRCLLLGRGMARNGIESFTRRKSKIVSQCSEQDELLVISITVDKTTYPNKPNMKLQGAVRLLCGMFCDVNALEATLSMLHHDANEQNHDDFPSCKKLFTNNINYQVSGRG